jgi:RNA polymerase sigma-70 factor (ECF subfamily)
VDLRFWHGHCTYQGCVTALNRKTDLTRSLNLKGMNMQTEMARPNEDLNPNLLHRCRKNDPEACNQLFSHYSRKIYKTAYRILGEEASAQDALQETLLNVYRGLSNFRGDSKVSTWISKITVNVCLGMLRKSKNRQTVDLENESIRELPAELTPYTDPLQHASINELRAVIDTTFRRMTPKQGVVVRLHDMEGNTIEEIAHIIRCPVGTVKSRLFYGRQEFKDIFASLMAPLRAPCTVN